MDLHDGQLLQHAHALAAQHSGPEPGRPARRGDQDVLLVAERSRREQPAARPGGGDGQIVMPGGQPLQGLLGVPEGGAQGEALADVSGVRAGRARTR